MLIYILVYATHNHTQETLMLDTRKITTLAKAISDATTQHTRRDIVFPAACQQTRVRL